MKPLTLFSLAGAAALALLIGLPLVAQTTRTTPELSGDFRNAAVGEVKDAQGGVVLRGEFAPVDEDDDDIERKAVLKVAGSDTDAAGEAEVEFPKSGEVIQEVEFSVRKLSPNGRYTFVIDGKTIAAVTADGDGDAEVDLKVRLPAGLR